jgi:hypothetical protein
LPPLKPPAEPNASPSTAHMPGSHTLLSPLNGSRGPLMEAPFTANTEPEWKMTETAASIDPLGMQPGASRDGVVGHAPDVHPPSEQMPDAGGSHVDQARSAVESALSAAPYTPDFSPVQALNAMPMVDDLHSGQAPIYQPPQQDLNQPAPPPVPPPLMPSQGVVIPPPFSPNNGNSLDKTL